MPVTPDGAAVLMKRSEGKAPSDFVIADPWGRWVATNSFSSALFREMRKLGIAATAHDLRDTLSTTIAREMVERRGLQAGLLAAARHLGHSSTKSLGLNLAGLGAADIRVDDEVITVVVGADESLLDAWRTAMARFGDRVHVEHDWTGSYIEF